MRDEKDLKEVEDVAEKEKGPNLVQDGLETSQGLIKIRPVTVRDLRRTQKWVNNMEEREFQLLVRLSRKNPEDLDKLKLDEYAVLINGVRIFLAPLVI